MAVRYVQSLRALGPSVWLYLLSVALVGFALDGGVYAVLLNLFLRRMGYGPELIGVVNSVGTLAFALTSLPAGALGARWGSRPVMLAGIAIMAVSTLLLPLADTLAPAWQLPWLLGNSVVVYLGLALFFVNTAPFVMEMTPPERRAEVFSLQTALLSLAAFAGSLIGGALPPAFGAAVGVTLDQPAPFRYALLVAGLALIPATLAIHAARPSASGVPYAAQDVATPASPAVVAARSLFGVLALIALVRLLQVAGIGATTTFFNVYLDAELLVPTAQIGVIIATARLLGVPAALATAALTKRYGNRAVVIGASLGSALSILPLALVPHWAAAGLGFIGVVGLSWIRYASSLVFFLELVPPSRRALASGVTEMAGGLCFTLLTFGGGYMIALLGYQSLFLTGAAITALSALVFWLAFRNVEPAGEGKALP